ncbi:hypothetical protein JR316_0010500 [Psilocybe cubensis]|uniref:Uncharacterized protein n=2 Tax=Psilocybe cubensis TaxID=181762 RepID=A0A8H8CDI5_PSICU|nr:hypothetical protein JR316_0010500 [Psilocybe cubensis]KAH9476588.1 hypothetical protein JR316_0010500 [Psilocybe cubensis]
MDLPPPSLPSKSPEAMGASGDQPQPASGSTSLQPSSQLPVSSTLPGPSSSSQPISSSPPSNDSGTASNTESTPTTSENVSGTQTPAPATMVAPPVLPFRGVNFSSVRVPRPLELVSPAMILLVITVGHIVGIFDREDQIDMGILFLVPGYAIRQFFSWAEAIAYYTERFNAGNVRIVQPVRSNSDHTALSLAPTPTVSSSAPIPPGHNPRTASTSSSSPPTLPTAPTSRCHPTSSNSAGSAASASSRSTASQKIQDSNARFGTEPNPIPIGFGDALTARAIRLSRQYRSPTRGSSTSRIRAPGTLGSPIRPSKRLRIIKSRKNTAATKTPSWDDSDEDAQVVKSRTNKGKAPVRNANNDVFSSSSAAGTGPPPPYSTTIAASSSSNPPALDSSSSATASVTPSLAAPPSPNWGQGPSRPATPYPPYTSDDFYAGRWSFTREDRALFERLGEVIRDELATAATPSDWPTLSDEAHERRRDLLRVIGQHLVGLYPRSPQPTSSSSNAPNVLINGAGSSQSQAGSSQSQAGSSQSQAGDSLPADVMDTSSDGNTLDDGLERPDEP